MFSSTGHCFLHLLFLHHSFMQTDILQDFLFSVSKNITAFFRTGATSAFFFLCVCCVNMMRERGTVFLFERKKRGMVGMVMPLPCLSCLPPSFLCIWLPSYPTISDAPPPPSCPVCCGCAAVHVYVQLFMGLCVSWHPFSVLCPACECVIVLFDTCLFGCMFCVF